ncbi:LysR substrate-binding domain-containing protein [Vibrio comitans]
MTRAANEMHVTQSAMSYSLQRLRDTFDDPLFTRVARGLVPTSKAIEIGEQLPQILGQLNLLMKPEKFNPMNCKQTFSVAIPQMLGTIALPNIITHILKEAPLVNLVEHSSSLKEVPDVRDGLLDFAVHYEEINNVDFRQTYVGHVKGALFARKRHPIFRTETVDVAQTIQYPIIGINVESDGNRKFDAPVNNFLSTIAPSTTTKFRSVQTQVLIDVMNHSDALFFSATCLKKHTDHGKSFKQVLPLEQFQLPLYLIQHKRNEDNDAHIWFESLLAKELRAILEE